MPAYLMLDHDAVRHTCPHCIGVFADSTKAFSAVAAANKDHAMPTTYAIELDDNQIATIAAIHRYTRTEDHPIIYTNHAELGITR